MIYSIFGLYLVVNSVFASKCAHEMIVIHHPKCKGLESLTDHLKESEASTIIDVMLMIPENLNAFLKSNGAKGPRCTCKVGTWNKGVARKSKRAFFSCTCSRRGCVQDFVPEKLAKIKHYQTADEAFTKHLKDMGMMTQESMEKNLKKVFNKLINLMELINVEVPDDYKCNPDNVNAMMTKLVMYGQRTVEEFCLAPADATMIFLNNLKQSIDAANTTEGLVIILDQAMKKISTVKEMKKQLADCANCPKFENKSVPELFVKMLPMMQTTVEKARQSMELILLGDVEHLQNQCLAKSDISLWTCAELLEITGKINQVTNKINGLKRRRRMTAFECASNKWF